MDRLLLIILFFSVNICNSQTFKRLTTEQGLSKNWVRCIYQDNDGLMWFGTAGGLDIYDGYDVKNLNIGNYNVNAFLSYSQNQILICTDFGVVLYDKIKGRLDNLPILRNQSVLCVARENENFLWFGTNNGIYRYKIKEKILESFSIDNFYINTIFIDSEKNIWAGTKDGISKFNRKTNRFNRYFNEIFKRQDIFSINRDYKNRYWIGSSNKGLYYIEEINHKSPILFLESSIINSFIDSKNNLWIARGNGQKLVSIDLNKNLETAFKFKKEYSNKIEDNQSISDNSIFCIFEDKGKNIWIGTQGGGVNYLNTLSKKFIKRDLIKENIHSSNIINCIYDDSLNTWIGTENGLLLFDKRQNRYYKFSQNLVRGSGLKGNAIYSIYKDKNQNIWIGTWAGALHLFNKKSKTFETFIPKNNLGIQTLTNITSICEDNQGFIWIGTIGNGLLKFDPINKKFIYDFHKTHDFNTSIGQFINQIIKLKNGKLLISEYYAIDIYDTKNNSFERYRILNRPHSLNDVSINAIYEDSKQTIWIATNKDLQYFQKNKGFKELPIYDGSNEQSIYAITEDAHNNLWISTNKGISKIIGGINLPEIPTLTNFTQNDGIAGNESINRSLYKNDEGNIFIGSYSGLTIFNPDSIKQNNEIPQIIISDILQLQKFKNEKFAYISISNNVNELKSIDIDYSNTNFIIKFAALNYFNNEKNTYKYILEGYNSNWIDAGNQRSITYTNLEPGVYTFKIIASNNDGLWTTKPKTIKIIITTPWWKTTTFRISLIAIIALLIYLFFRLRFSIIQRQKKILEQTVASRTKALNAMNVILRENQAEIKKQNIELYDHRNNLEKLVQERTIELEMSKKKAEENDKLKTAFLQNISHEIRTPMNAIIGFANLLKQKELSNNEKEQYIDIINLSGKQLLSIINDIINIATIESGQAKINESVFNLNSILKMFTEQFKFKVESKKLNLTYQLSIEDVNAIIKTDETKFLEIFSNLLNNAIKFTENGGINYGYTLNGNNLLFFVEDTGIGIDPENQIQIFERFRQAESTIASRYGGTGLGLSICKAYVELLGGKIWVESELNKGAKFYFTIPNTFLKQSQSINIQNNTHSVSNDVIRILVVEDEDFNFRFLQKILMTMKFDVIRAQNGIEAIDICRNDKTISLVFMDIKMPEMDGYEATRRIREFLPDIPIIAQTAYAMEKDKEKAFEVGVNDYLAKPIEKQSLIDILNKYFGI